MLYREWEWALIHNACQFLSPFGDKPLIFVENVMYSNNKDNPLKKRSINLSDWLAGSIHAFLLSLNTNVYGICMYYNSSTLICYWYVYKSTVVFLRNKRAIIEREWNICLTCSLSLWPPPPHEKASGKRKKLSNILLTLSLYPSPPFLPFEYGPGKRERERERKMLYFTLSLILWTYLPET